MLNGLIKAKPGGPFTVPCSRLVRVLFETASLNSEHVSNKTRTGPEAGIDKFTGTGGFGWTGTAKTGLYSISGGSGKAFLEKREIRC